MNVGALYFNVMEKLKFDPRIDESNITIAVTNDSIVVLGGKVKSFTEKYVAEESVRKLQKVRGVANELEVDLSVSYKRKDADIVKIALNSLEWTLFIPHERIKVSVDNGHLTLNGQVEYNYQKEAAQNAVQDLYGVTFVSNNIRVTPTISPTEVKNKIIKEFERNARIDAANINIEVDGGIVTLKGKVRNFDEEKEARSAAWSVPGVSNVIDLLTIS